MVAEICLPNQSRNIIARLSRGISLYLSTHSTQILYTFITSAKMRGTGLERA